MEVTEVLMATTELQEKRSPVSRLSKSASTPRGSVSVALGKGMRIADPRIATAKMCLEDPTEHLELLELKVRDDET